MIASPVSAASAQATRAGPERRPDPDSIKMFVGQIPRTMNESELREMFGEFGDIYQLNVLRDKVSGLSKGCCFVTFYTRQAAISAQNALHNLKILPGMPHPIQMKPADTEKKNVEDRKLFIGMISKKAEEVDIQTLFSSFGPIEECTVLRDANGNSKGCAFVTFSSRQSALSAIKQMHQKTVMDGCAMPLVVKFADTTKEKENRKLQTMLQNFLSVVNANNSGPMMMGSPSGSNSVGAFANLGANQMMIQQLVSNMLANGGLNPDITSLALNNPAMLSQLMGQASADLQLSSPSSPGLSLNGSMGNSLSSMAFTNPNGFTTSAPPQAIESLTYAAPPISALLTRGVMSPSNQQLFRHPMQAPVVNPAGKVTEGPDGANLFIYHLPQEYTDQELVQTFIPFGNVISAKVYVDKQTNMSKCFGFVSYDHAESAQAAIQAMNGFQIGMKRLKVQLKRPKNDSKPY